MYHTVIFNIPTVLTLIRAIVAPIVLSILILLCVPQQNVWLNIVISFLFVCGALTDFMDGYLARALNQQTVLGAMLDPIADKLYVSSLFIVLVAVGLLNPLWAIILIGREIYITSLRYIAATYTIDIPVIDNGKQKTAIHMILISVILLTAHNNPVSGLFALIIKLLLISSLWLSIISAYKYTAQFWDSFGKKYGNYKHS
jgi:CDP-diacylglycerol--glycerol-3-phosphate 3-phosphatidyltransferase